MPSTPPTSSLPQVHYMDFTKINTEKSVLKAARRRNLILQLYKLCFNLIACAKGEDGAIKTAFCCLFRSLMCLPYGKHEKENGRHVLP